jgi:hypothetical protein
MKKLLSIVLALTLILSFGGIAFAATGDTQVASATLAGVAIDLGTPVISTGFGSGQSIANIAAFSAAGSVTLTTAQLTDAEFAITEESGWDDDTGVVRVEAGDAATFDDISDISGDATAAYTETYAANDYVVFKVSDGSDTYIYAILITLNDGGSSNSGSETGNDTVTGDGETKYINLEIYEVTLPTGDLLNFTLDPQGLYAIASGETKDLAALGGGAIFSNGTAAAINNSSVDVKLSIELTGTGNATFIAYDDTDEKTKDKVEGDTANNILLYAVPSAVDISTEATEYVASGSGFVIEDSASSLEFILGAAAYEIENNADVYTATPKEGTGHGTAIQLGGYVNSKADWSDYVEGGSKSVGVQAVFSYEKATVPVPEEADIYGLITELEGAALTLVPAVVPVGFVGGDSLTEITLQISELSSPHEIAFSFGDYELSKVETKSGVDVTADYIKGAGKLTVAAAQITTLKARTSSTFHTIKLSNGLSYQVNYEK